MNRCMSAPDFREGIRALLVDKDQNPRFQPTRLEDVTDEQVERFFQSLGEYELTLD
ncbi:hypothetical protein EON63_16835 [archaeon]|nr:MAG: hypothetical protein EON63_16835 [archaeon]